MKRTRMLLLMAQLEQMRMLLQLRLLQSEKRPVATSLSSGVECERRRASEEGMNLLHDAHHTIWLISVSFILSQWSHSPVRESSKRERRERRGDEQCRSIDSKQHPLIRA